MGTDDIGKGCVVESEAGRDKGKLFFVLDVSEGYALLVDGRIRRVENPKRKKIKHIRFVSKDTETRLYTKISSGVRPENAEIRKAISSLRMPENDGT